MNITKWIHLTYGDEGIKKLFANIDSLTKYKINYIKVKEVY
jgi:hypothetical protein